MNVLPEHMQRDVLRLLQEGKSQRAIARDMGIAVGTVRRYASAVVIGRDRSGEPVYGIPDEAT